MDQRRRNNLLVTGLVIAVAAIAVVSVIRFEREFRTSDAAMVLQRELRSEITQGRSLSVPAVNAMALRLERASVCSFRFDRAGNALDGWGTPLRIDLCTGTVVSAGPDARFDTDDDVRAPEFAASRP